MGYGKIKAYLRKVLFSIRKDLLPKIRQSLFCKNKKNIIIQDIFTKMFFIIICNAIEKIGY